jgi:hypothetical protein
MKARVIIEYDLDRWEAARLGLVKLKEREERRWMMSDTLLWLWSPTVKVELLRDGARNIGKRDPKAS